MSIDEKTILKWILMSHWEKTWIAAKCLVTVHSDQPFCQLHASMECLRQLLCHQERIPVHSVSGPFTVSLYSGYFYVLFQYVLGLRAAVQHRGPSRNWQFKCSPVSTYHGLYAVLYGCETWYLLVLYCLYCVFVVFRLCIFILICFFCAILRTTATEWQLNCGNNNNIIIIIIIIIMNWGITEYG
jgi:hypothetical protein